MSVEIIAEIGVNHNADLELAFSMIKKAAKSGADIIKFQTAIPELVQTANAPMADYQIRNTGYKVSQLEMSKKIHFPLEVFSTLKSEVEALKQQLHTDRDKAQARIKELEELLRSRDYTRQHDYKFLVDENKKLHKDVSELKEDNKKLNIKKKIIKD